MKSLPEFLLPFCYFSKFLFSFILGLSSSSRLHFHLHSLIFFASVFSSSQMHVNVIQWDLTFYNFLCCWIHMVFLSFASVQKPYSTSVKRTGFSEVLVHCWETRTACWRHFEVTCTSESSLMVKIKSGKKILTHRCFNLFGPFTLIAGCQNQNLDTTNC